MWGTRDPTIYSQAVAQTLRGEHRKWDLIDGRPLKQGLFITVSRALISVQNRGPEDTGIQ